MSKIAIVAATVVAAAAGAQTVDRTIDFTFTADVPSFDAFLDGSNAVALFDLEAVFAEDYVDGSVNVIGAEWDVTIETVGASWLSEAAIYLTNAGVTTGVVFTPGVGDDFAGTASYSGSSDYVAAGIDFFLDADNVLRVEFAEGFDDVADAADAFWKMGGSLSLDFTAQLVPAPGAAAIVGFGGLVAMRRRR